MSDFKQEVDDKARSLHAKDGLPPEQALLQARVFVTLNVATRYGGIDGAHHKDWTIDQICRVLAGGVYEEFVAEACHGEDGPNTYGWEVGVAP